MVAPFTFSASYDKSLISKGRLLLACTSATKCQVKVAQIEENFFSLQNIFTKNVQKITSVFLFCRNQMPPFPSLASDEDGIDRKNNES